MMTIILGAIIYFIIGGIVVGIMTIIDDDTEDDTGGELAFIGILWPISFPLLIGLAIIAIVGELVNIIAEFFIKNKKH